MDTFMDQSDEKLIEIIRTRDKEVYKIIIERYQNKLYRYANYLVKDEAKASDIVQESFIKAYENLNSFNTNRKFSSWVYRIVHNEAMNELRRKPHFSLDINLTNILPNHEPMPEEQYEKQELSENMKNCMDKLEISYREPLILFFMENKSYNEISDILRIPTSTVGTKIRRGKKLLKKICEENLNGKN